MTIANFFNNIGKWRTDSEVFAKFFFTPTPEGDFSVQIHQFYLSDPSGENVNSFQNDLDFWMIGGHLLKWFANLAYISSDYSGFFKKMSDYIASALDISNPLPIPEGLDLDPMRTKIPHTEIVISRPAHGINVLTYDIPFGKNGNLAELYMIGLTIRHLITIYPNGRQLFLNGFGMLLKIHQNGYPLTEMKRGTTAASVIIDKIFSDVTPEEQQASLIAYELFIRS